MKVYLQCVGAVLIGLIVILALGSKGKEFSVLLAVGVCAMGCIALLVYLEPVIEFIHQLEQAGGLDAPVMKILLKAVGVGLISEVGALLCTDCGNGSLGKLLQLLGSSVVLWLSLPLFTMLLELIQELLGGI